MSPESMSVQGRDTKSDLRLMVDQFYDALRARDPDAVASAIDEHFAPDARLVRPESLPGGGELAGAKKIKRLMVAVAGADSGPFDPATMRIERVLEETHGDVDFVVVELSFPWAGTPTRALECWTVRDLKVIEIRAFYWDTAMMLRI
jgi:ketosteroid isomerase-like protein